MQNAIKQNDFTFDGWKYNTMPVIKNAGDQNTEDNKGYYIDLPIEMPFTSDEISVIVAKIPLEAEEFKSVSVIASIEDTTLATAVLVVSKTALNASLSIVMVVSEAATSSTFV